MKHLIPLCLLLTLLASSICGQRAVRETSLPDSVMQQAVRQILKRQIKPRPQPELVYILDHFVTEESLPKIAGVEFRIVRDHDCIRQKGYGFKHLRKARGRYLIDFGFGDLGYGRTEGTTWAFSVRRAGIRSLALTHYGWGFESGGTGCD
jgi:hypothetical protein